jgi:type VI secretion system protein ImpK
MSNKNDDPFAPSDATILRPKPGAGRRPGPAPSAPAPPPPQAPPAYQPSYRPASEHSPAAVPESGGLGDFLSTGINPLVQAATALLVLAGKLRGQVSNADVDSLRRQATQEVRSFEDHARQAGIPAEDVLAARYVLCTTIDEAVLNTPWGAQSGWASQSLLVTFHRESFGGEKFFQILERIAGEPQRYQHLLELIYVCVSLGFEGKYRLDERGAVKLADIRQDLYRRIRNLRGTPESELSPLWKGVEDKRNAVIRFVPLWVVAVACVTILAGVFFFFHSRLGSKAEPVQAALAQAGVHAPVATAAPLAPTGLPQLLKEEIDRHRVSVEERPDRVVITLLSTDLFPSGSARINPALEPLVHRIGAALERLPGRILVVGHTDDQPIRSLRYADNYELSRERAMQVVKLMKDDIKNKARVDSSGAGPSEPRYKPPELPENRARNRRVEINYLPEG